MTVSQYGPVSRAPGSQGFPLDVLETKTLMWGGSTRIMEAEGTCMISARRFTISCHFRMISEGTSIECASLELRSCDIKVFFSIVWCGAPRCPVSIMVLSFACSQRSTRPLSDGVSIPRTIKSLLEGFDPARRPLLFTWNFGLLRAVRDGS